MDDSSEGRRGLGEVLRNMGSEEKPVDPFAVKIINKPAPLERLERIAEATDDRMSPMVDSLESFKWPFVEKQRLSWSAS